MSKPARHALTHPLVMDAANAAHAPLRVRRRREGRFRWYGKLAITISLLFLAALFLSLISRGYGAFWQTHLLLDVTLQEQVIDPDGTRDVATLNRAPYRSLVHQSLGELFPEAQSLKEKRLLYTLLSREASLQIKEMVVANPTLIGTVQPVWLLASSVVDMAHKGRISQEVPEERRQFRDQSFAWLQALKDEGRVQLRWNTRLWERGDSRSPERAGLLGGMMGSFFIIIICLIGCFPIGVGAAIYLQEFAPKNRLTDIIELNINNLAAVPSIVYGLLGLSVFLQVMELPRSSALVGGLTLSLLVLPTMIIATRQALAAVPPSVREAARGIGASPMQVVMHHVVPLSLPGIFTGTILSIARALGETAPLLMIGMVAFVADVPSGITHPTTALPVQVYLWSDSPELGFGEKTSAAILVLLTMLVTANALAIWLRKKYEIKW